MKNKQKLGKFCLELNQKFTVFSKTFLDDSFTFGFYKICLITFYLEPKSFGLHEFHNHLIST
jgi:hypothetical protein